MNDVTDPKEKGPLIKTRQPRKSTPADTFANIRKLPHPVEELLSSTVVPEYRSTEAEEDAVKPTSPIGSTPVLGELPRYRGTAVPESKFYRKSNEVSDQADRELTPAESKVLDHLWRLSVGFNTDVCRVRVSKLQERTGYRSDKTVRTALAGLETKGRIKRLSHYNSPLGDEYRINHSGNTGVPEYRSTAAENTAVLESKITGELNTRSKDKDHKTDDEPTAFGGLVEELKQVAHELTGKDPASTDGERWRELARVLTAELRIAAARTTVSNVPAFLAEHLRRRLWKLDQRQAAERGIEPPDKIPAAAPKAPQDCPDCKGAGWWYPQGQEKGVAKCRHERAAPR